MRPVDIRANGIVIFTSGFFQKKAPIATSMIGRIRETVDFRILPGTENTRNPQIPAL